MKWLRLVLLGLAVGAVAAFVVELLVPRRPPRASGYVPPVSATDRHAVLPQAVRPDAVAG